MKRSRASEPFVGHKKPVIKSAYHLHGKPRNSGENSNGTVHPGGNFPEESNIFELLPFSLFSETTEIVCTTCLDYQCQASGREKAKNLPVFSKWYNSIPFLFSLTKTKYQQHLTEIFHRNFRANGERSNFDENRKRKRKTDKVVKFSLVNEKHLLI